jgi:hypothetical protein
MAAKPATGLTTFGSSTTGTTTQLDNNFTAITGVVNDLNSYANYLTDTGGANAYAASLPASTTGALTAGLRIQFKASASNTGASTFNWNAGGALNILRSNGSALSAGDIVSGAIADIQYDGTQWRLMNQTAATLTLTTSALGADVSLNNTANYFDGPTIAQGTSGTWFVSGSVVLEDTAGAARFFAKLWDGTTVIASGYVTIATASQPATISLSGNITTPAGNLRISARDTTSTSGFIRFNASGNSKDAVITAIRIA